MKYQVIARRYRPRRFEEVVGQESVGTTLRNAILHDRLAHAYLFAGPRGVGKTSMARIFAKALNCPQASDRSRPAAEWALPCDACDLCRAIHSGEDMDVLEVDGASYRGIDDVRDIVENVKFIPTRSPYKIFIIDEIHMLTREAFNALLKTLEEPPSHVKFIFATTEAHKIPETVLSRCQRFDFRPIGEEDIVKRLEQIARSEGVEAENALLLKIARYGKGGLRDAQTLLDQAITFSEEGKLAAEDLERITGRLPDASIDTLMSHIAGRDAAGTLRAVEECFAAGADPAILLDQVIERSREHLLKSSSAPPGEGAEGASADLDAWLGRLQVLHETALKLRGSPQPRLAVELSLVKIARMADPRALEEALAYLRSMPAPEMAAVPSRPAPVQSSPPAAPPPRAAPPEEAAPPPPAPRVEEVRVEPPPAGGNGGAHAPGAVPAPEAAHEPAAEPASFDSQRLKSLWDQIQIEAQERLPQMSGFLSKTRLGDVGEDGTFTLLVDSDFHWKQLREPRRAREFEGLVGEVTGAPWRMSLKLEPASAATAAPAGGAPGAAAAPGPVAPGAGPTKGSTKPSAGKPSGATKPAGGRASGGADLRDDPLVKKSVDIFKGRIV